VQSDRKAAQEAGAEAWKEYLKAPNKTFFDTTNGRLSFRSYINLDKNNTPYIGNVHPMKYAGREFDARSNTRVAELAMHLT
jgi:hypothetical protein